MYFAVPVLAREVEGAGQRSPPGAIEIGVDLGEQGTALTQQLAERLEHQLVLAVEVRIEAPDCQPRRPHDLIDAGLGRAVLDQRTARSFQNAFAGFALLVAHLAHTTQNMMIEILFSSYFLASKMCGRLSGANY
ncbi:hypothetical protein D9M73_238990 [compost metagenome]